MLVSFLCLHTGTVSGKCCTIVCNYLYQNGKCLGVVLFIVLLCLPKMGVCLCQKVDKYCHAQMTAFLTERKEYYGTARVMKK